MSVTHAIAKGKKSGSLAKVMIASIHGYQKFVSPLLHRLLGVQSACRSVPSCSEYAQDVFAQYGFARGMVLSIRRLINCQPFFKI